MGYDTPRRGRPGIGATTTTVQRTEPGKQNADEPRGAIQCKASQNGDQPICG